MPQSLSRVLVHGVFSTKNRDHSLVPEIQGDLYSYLAAILESKKHFPIKIGGYTDHVHLLFGLSRTMAMSDTIELLKVSSSKWLKSKSPELSSFSWQLGYGIFSVSPEDSPIVVDYIERQNEHHSAVSFQDELRKLLTENGIPFDEKYLWD